jgi:cationic peptide transport system ATP-binding protein
MLAAGQKQRVCLARALILQPSIIIADEALNGLDMAMRSQIINLFLELQDEMGVSFVYASQHIGIIKHITDKVMVMHEGDVVEYGESSQVLTHPEHPVTQRLVESHFYKAPNYKRCS